MNFFRLTNEYSCFIGSESPNEQEYFCMKSKDFEWLTDEFMLYCPCLRLQLTPETKNSTIRKDGAVFLLLGITDWAVSRHE